NIRYVPGGITMCTGAEVGGLVSAGSSLIGAMKGPDTGQAKYVQRPHNMFDDMMAKLMSDPTNEVEKLPGFKFGLDQGLTAAQRRLAASGFGGSGNEATALTQYATDYSQQFFGNYINQL